jgi:hypothetical protein
MPTESEVLVPSDEAAKPNDAPGDAAETPPLDEAAEKPEGEVTPEQKTIRALQRRIDRLTAGKGAASREAELLREQLAQVQQKPGQDDEPKAIDPSEIDRLASEKAKVLHQQQTIATRSAAVITAGKKLPGFDAAVNAVAEEVPFTDRKGAPTPFIEAVLDTDEPAKVLHWLGNNPDEAAQFANLSPVQIGRRLAKIEERISREAKANTSGAPKPLEAVKGAGGGSKDITDTSLSYADFVALRKAQIAKRR